MVRGRRLNPRPLALSLLPLAYLSSTRTFFDHTGSLARARAATTTTAPAIGPASGWPRFDFVLRRGNGTTLCSDHEHSRGFFLFLRKDLLAATPMSRADYQWIEAKAGQTGWLFKAAQHNTIHRCSTTQHSHR